MTAKLTIAAEREPVCRTPCAGSARAGVAHRHAVRVSSVNELLDSQTSNVMSDS